MDQEEPTELPQIKEEQKELQTSQQEEQAQGFEEAGTKLTLTEEDDEDKPQSSRCHQTEPMMASNVEDHNWPRTLVQMDICNQIVVISQTPLDGRLTATREPQSGFKSERKNSGCRIGKKSFSCTERDKRFSKNQSVRANVRIHAGETLFICSVCGKRFTWQSSLPPHVRRHSEEKRFSL